MSITTLLAVLLGLPITLWALWFVIEFVRYLMTGEYEVDQRLNKIGE